MGDQTFRLAIFASGTGSNARAIHAAWGAGNLPGLKPVFLFSDKDSPAAEWAAQKGMDTLVLKPHAFEDRAAHERAVLRELRSRDIDLIALAGYMRLLSPVFVKAYDKRILNIHPALLPAYPGLDAISRAYEAGDVYSGVTVHLVDEGMDTGPVLAQCRVDRTEDMSLEAFTAAMHRAEHALYPETLAAYAEYLSQYDTHAAGICPRLAEHGGIPEE